MIFLSKIFKNEVKVKEEFYIPVVAFNSAEGARKVLEFCDYKTGIIVLLDEKEYKELIKKDIDKK